MILLTKEEHQKVLLNVKVNLLWTNIDGTFVGPFVSTEVYKQYFGEPK